MLIDVLAPLPVALLLLFGSKFGTSKGIIVFGTTVKTRLPDAVRGRVFVLLDVT